MELEIACRTTLVVKQDALPLTTAQMLLLSGNKNEAFSILNSFKCDPVAKETFKDVVFNVGENVSTLFTVRGEPYRYFIAMYNHTWLNERIVEISFALKFLQRNSGKCLEIGNVLHHYFSCNHTVVDRYEKYPGIISEDILAYNPGERFKTIIAISTLEHIGHDKMRDDTKVLRVYDHIVRDLLADDGAFLFTVPVGFNPVIDNYIDTGVLRPDDHICLKRVSEENDWIEVQWKDIRSCKYMEPFHCANGMYFGIVYGQKHPVKQLSKPPVPKTSELLIAQNTTPSVPGPSKGRIESNTWLRRVAKGITGDVLSIGSRDDRDGEGSFYRHYFQLALSYTTSDICGAVDLNLDIRNKTTVPDGRFNCIFCSGVLEHVDDFHAGLAEITRMLKAGGTLLLGLPFRQAIHDAPTDFWRFTRYAIEYLLKKEYTILEIKEIDCSVNDFPAAYWVQAIKK